MKKKELTTRTFIKGYLLLSAGLAMGLSPLASLESRASVNDSQVITQSSTTVKGHIVDENGEPLIGASVVVNGNSANGVVTDLNGAFTLNNVPANGTIKVTYIGYKEQTLKIQGRTNIEIKLEPENNTLNELVVVGYGTQKKATLTGSVSMVEGDEVLKGRASTNIGTALQGTIPGMTITRNSSRPTDNVSINIRGGISANGSSPLILIDGVDAYAWELNTLNPNDIESVSVLKDAAASIYGARAAGGVILITTKRGNEGKPTITYNGSATVNYRGKDYPAASGSEWARMMLMADYNDTNHPAGATSLWSIMGFNREAYLRVMNNEAFDWENSGHTYRIDPLNADQVEAVYGTTWGTSHNLSIQGGGKKLRSRTSLGYGQDRSLIKITFDGQRKYNFRNNTDFNLGKYVKVETAMSYDTKKTDVPTYGIGYGLQDFYVFPLYTKSGKKFYDNFGGNNVLGHLKEGGKTVTHDYMVRLSGKVTVDLSFINPVLQGLSAYAKGSIRQYNMNKKEQSHFVQFYDYYTDEVVNNAKVSSRTKYEKLSETNTRALYQLYEFFLNYDRTFGNHHVSAMFGNTNELRDNHSTTEYRSGGTDYIENADLNLYDHTTDRITNSEAYKWSYVSLVSRLNYDYAGKYLVEGTWRHDGSSRLVKNNRWDDFWGFSAGWRISEESFMKNLDWLSNLKFRFSWGQSGNVSTIGNYEAYPAISTGTTVYGYPGTLYSTSWISGITDDSRTWERVNSTNIGVDYGFFNNRLNGSFDYFWRKNDGMLINITYPATYGGTAPSTNSGIYKTHGWEFTINWNDRIGKDFRYNVGFTLANAKTEVTSYEGKTAINWGVNSIVEGKPLNALYVFKTDGMFQTQDEVDAYYNEMNGSVSGSLLSNVKQGTVNELTPGCVRRVDINGDHDITKADLYYYGDTDPHYTFSLNIGAEYKGFDFKMFFQGVGQQYNVRNGQMGCAFWSGWTNTNGYFMDHTWYAGDPDGIHAANTDAKFPLISRNGNRNNWNYKNYNDVNVINNWYARCKELQIGYTLPRQWLINTPFQSIRAWVSGENLFDISNVKDGYDPETKSSMGTYSGVDVFASSISFGLDVTF
ncbi:MAG: SusC/RagA family TonB-linked outer membrane protein [Prevotella sp.]|jgi:TonB-linked SusC/RagA family outer membrane protein